MTAQARPTMMRRARHRLRIRGSEIPGIYLPFARRKYPGPSPEVISSATELVIDGYTRSASTFAVYALQLAQATPVRLAHHLHAPAWPARAAGHAGAWRWWASRTGAAHRCGAEAGSRDNGHP